ncbi:uncharacterized protein METZ01_LOCUS349308, partial [marine metagenome]
PAPGLRCRVITVSRFAHGLSWRRLSIGFLKTAKSYHRLPLALKEDESPVRQKN